MDEIKKMAAGHSIEALDAIMTEVEEARGEYDNLGERLDEMSSDTPTPSTAAPAMDGTAAAGTSTDYARADHIHPSDTSKQDALTAAQLAAANSGIDSAKVEQIETNKNNISFNTNNGVKNIITGAEASTTRNNVTFTVNADGSITVKTGASGASGSDATFFKVSTCTVMTTGTWVLSGGYSASCRLQDANNNWQSGVTASEKTFTTDTTYNIFIRIQPGWTNTDGVTLYPMICPKSLYDAAPSYQPYAMSNAELTAAIQALQAQLANQ